MTGTFTATQSDHGLGAMQADIANNFRSTCDPGGSGGGSRLRVVHPVRGLSPRLRLRAAHEGLVPAVRGPPARPSAGPVRRPRPVLQAGDPLSGRVPRDSSHAGGASIPYNIA